MHNYLENLDFWSEFLSDEIINAEGLTDSDGSKNDDSSKKIEFKTEYLKCFWIFVSRIAVCK